MWSSVQNNLYSQVSRVHTNIKASLIAQLVNLPAMQETLVGFLGLKDWLEKG